MPRNTDVESRESDNLLPSVKKPSDDERDLSNEGMDRFLINMHL